MMWPGNSRWTPKFQRTLYGFVACGSKKVTNWPRKVPAPALDPAGRTIPFGKGFESVAAGVR